MHVEVSVERATRYGVVAGVVVALVLRLLFLQGKSLWLDEALSLRVAQAGPAAWLAGSVERYHPPLYFWLLSYWLPLGDSELMLRLPSVLLGVASVYLLYRVGQALGGTAVGLTTLWLAALSPLLVWYAQEVRSYSLVTFLGVLGLYALVRLADRPWAGWWLLLAAAMAAALYAHYTAALLMLLQVAFLVLLLARRRLQALTVLYWLLAWVVAALAYWPWLQTEAAARFFNLLLSENSYAELNLSFLYLLRLGLVGLVLILLVGLPLAYWLLRQPFWIRLRERSWLRALLAVGFVVLLIVFVVPRAYTLKRQLVIFWPYALLFFAWFWPWQAATRRLLAGVLLLSLVASLVNIFLVPKDQWRETVAYILAHSQPGDAVVLLPSYMNIPFRYYSQGRIFSTGIRPNSASAQLKQLLAEHERIWYVHHTIDMPDPEGQIEQWLQAHAHPEENQAFYHTQLHLYRR